MKLHTSIVTACSLILFIFVGNFLASRHFLRLDVTDNREFTLAEATKQMLRDLDDVVTVRVYFTKELPPQLTPLQRGVEDLLAEYQGFGAKNFQVEYRDPQRDPQTEREVVLMGIQPMELNVVKRDKQEVAKIYLGLVMLHGDQKEVIPIDPRDPTRHLEESLTAAMLKLTRERTPVVGWIAAEQRPEGEGFHLAQELIRQRVTVETVTSADVSLDPKRFDAVVVLADGPEVVSEGLRFALDQYLGAGGKVLLFANRVAVQPGFMGTEQVLGLEPLLEAYGLRLPPRLVADAIANYAAFRSGVVTYTLPYPLWPIASQEVQGLNREHPVVGRLESLTLPWVSPIEFSGDAPAGLERIVLAQSSVRSGVTAGEPPFSLEPRDATLLVPHSAGPRHPMVVSLRGVLPAAYGSGQLSAPAGSTASARGTAAGELVVVGTAHVLEDRFLSQQQFAEGATFFVNMVDHLTIGDALIGIRSRPVTARPIDPDLSASQKAVMRYGNMVGLPVLLVLGGLGGMALRRRRWQRLRAQYRRGRA